MRASANVIVALALRISAVIAVIMLLTVLPFLPGRYDAMAPVLSVMAQVFGKASLLLVPVGALWLLFKTRALAIAATVISTIVVFAVALVGAASNAFALGVSVFAVWLFVTWKQVQAARPHGHRPIYMIVVPIAVATLQMAIVAPAIESSRNRAIDNSALLIADIERYRASNGRYPISLLSVSEDYPPNVIGIERYRYEPAGDAYNLVFEQPALNLGTREFVVYNPLDQQVFTSHNMVLLRESPETLARVFRRGQYEVRDASRPHWKYFWFD